MTYNTPSGTKKHYKSIEPESYHAAKIFFFLSSSSPSDWLFQHDSFTVFFTQNSSI